MRSVPLMMNVPRSVIIGKSPMKTVCSLISPVVAFMNRAVTNSGRANVMSALAALLLGVLGRVEDVVGELELELTGEVLDGRDVGQDLGDPLVEEPLEGRSLDGDQVGKLEDLGKTGERKTLTGRETRQGGSSGNSGARADQGNIAERWLGRTDTASRIIAAG